MCSACSTAAGKASYPVEGRRLDRLPQSHHIQITIDHFPFRPRPESSSKAHFTDTVQVCRFVKGIEKRAEQKMAFIFLLLALRARLATNRPEGDGGGESDLSRHKDTKRKEISIAVEGSTSRQRRRQKESLLRVAAVGQFATICLPATGRHAVGGVAQ